MIVWEASNLLIIQLVGLSTAFGYATTSSGHYSTALGENSLASNTYAMSFGNTTCKWICP